MHINHNLYRYTEQALRDYPDECRRLKLLEEYLCAPAGPSEYVSGGESIPEQERILERFQFTPLREGRPQQRRQPLFYRSFNSRPCVRGDVCCSNRSPDVRGFNSRPCVRGDRGWNLDAGRFGCFNSRPCVRGDWGGSSAAYRAHWFQFTPLREGRQ